MLLAMIFMSLRMVSLHEGLGMWKADHKAAYQQFPMAWRDVVKAMVALLDPSSGKPKTFAQTIPGVHLRNNKGCPCLYPKAVWDFMKKHDSYDIERVAHDIQKGIQTKPFEQPWMASSKGCLLAHQ